MIWPLTFINFLHYALYNLGDGIIKPTWNKGVSWTIEALKESPTTLGNWGKAGWQKVSDFASEQTSSSTVTTEGN